MTDVLKIESAVKLIKLLILDSTSSIVNPRTIKFFIKKNLMRWHDG